MSPERPLTFFDSEGDGSQVPLMGVVKHDSPTDLLDGTAERKVAESCAEARAIYEKIVSGELPPEASIDDCGHVRSRSRTVVGYNSKYARGWNTIFGPRDN